MRFSKMAVAVAMILGINSSMQGLIILPPERNWLRESLQEITPAVEKWAEAKRKRIDTEQALYGLGYTSTQAESIAKLPSELQEKGMNIASEQNICAINSRSADSHYELQLRAHEGDEYQIAATVIETTDSPSIPQQVPSPSYQKIFLLILLALGAIGLLSVVIRFVLVAKNGKPTSRKSLLLLVASITLLNVCGVGFFYIWNTDRIGNYQLSGQEIAVIKPKDDQEKVTAKAKRDDYYLITLTDLEFQYKKSPIEGDFDKRFSAVRNDMLRDGYNEKDFQVFSSIANGRANEQLRRIRRN